MNRRLNIITQNLDFSLRSEGRCNLVLFILLQMVTSGSKNMIDISAYKHCISHQMPQGVPTQPNPQSSSEWWINWDLKWSSKHRPLPQRGLCLCYPSYPLVLNQPKALWRLWLTCFPTSKCLYPVRLTGKVLVTWVKGHVVGFNEKISCIWFLIRI